MRGTGTSGDGNGGNAVSVGAYQGDAFQSWGLVARYANFGGPMNESHNTHTSYVKPGNNTGPNPTILNVNPTLYDNGGGTPRTANETRPKSYGVLICIKA